MNPRLNKSRTFLKMRGKSVTLIELLISIALISLVVLGFSSIDLFSRHHLLTIDKRAQVQNEASYVLEHMTKEISKAIGDYNQPAVSTTPIGGNRAITVWIDYNQNGRRDPEPTDRRIAYRFTGSSAYQIRYCPRCTNPLCAQCSPNWGTILSRKITAFTPTYSSSNNYIDIQLTSRWDPDESVSTDNPEISMKNRIKMPAVSTN